MNDVNGVEILGLVAIVVVTVGVTVYPFLMLFDILRWPSSRWKEIGRSKWGWLALALLGSFVGALCYRLTVFRELRGAVTGVKRQPGTG